MAELSHTANERSTAIHLLDGVDKFIGLICRSIVLTTGVVLLIAIIVAVIARYVIDVGGIDWAEELPRQLFSWFIMAGVVLAAQQGAHIATTFLMEALPPAARRAVTVVAWVVVAGLYGTLAMATYRMLEIVHDERTPILRLPGSITYACVMGGMVMLAVLALQSAWRTWRSQPPQPADAADPPVPAAHW